MHPTDLAHVYTPHTNTHHMIMIIGVLVTKLSLHDHCVRTLLLQYYKCSSHAEKCTLFHVIER